MAQFRVGEHEYQSMGMLPETQLNVIARLAPLFTNYNTLRGLLGTVLKRADIQESVAAGAAPEVELETSTAKEAVNDELIRALSGIFSAFSTMSDADRHFVLSKVLVLCTRKSGTGWAKIWNDTAKKPMFDDIDLMTMLVIVKEVLQAELLPFFNTSVLSMFAGLLK